MLDSLGILYAYFSQFKVMLLGHLGPTKRSKLKITHWLLASAIYSTAKMETLAMLVFIVKSETR